MLNWVPPTYEAFTILHLQALHYPMGEALSASLYRWWNWCSEKWSHLPEVTQRGSICSSAARLQSPGWFDCTTSVWRVEKGGQSVEDFTGETNTSFHSGPPPPWERAALRQTASEGYNCSFSIVSLHQIVLSSHPSFLEVPVSDSSVCWKFLKCWCKDGIFLLWDEKRLLPGHSRKER